MQDGVGCGRVLVRPMQRKAEGGLFESYQIQARVSCVEQLRLVYDCSPAGKYGFIWGTGGCEHYTH